MSQGLGCRIATGMAKRTGLGGQVEGLPGARVLGWKLTRLTLFHKPG